MISNCYEARRAAGEQGGIVADQGTKSAYQGENRGEAFTHTFMAPNRGIANPYSDIVK
jgi:hypothetical protein